jgi:hypothetical protein
MRALRMHRPEPRRTVALFCAAAAGYVVLALALTWPLVRHMQTHVLGEVSGDTGVYVWNIWIFNHELFEHAHLPFSTGHVLAYSGGTDLSLHNYAPIAGLFGGPLIGPLGLIGTYNVILLVVMALSGVGTFDLARGLGLGAVASWCAGALFVGSPALTAREVGHLSLVIAASLPLFMWALLRALDSERVRDAALVGGIVAAATYSDAYYGIYCAMMGVLLVAWRFVRVEWRGPTVAWPRLARFLDVVIAITIIVIAGQVLSGATVVNIGPIRIGLETLYTPVMLLVLAAALRAWLRWRPVWSLDDPGGHLNILVRRGAVAVGVCLLLLLPQLIGVASAFLAGRSPSTDIYWRSSPRGVDALSYFVPNPSHPWFGDLTRDWLRPGNHPNWFPEFIGSFSLVAFAVIAAGAWFRVLPRFWVAFTAFFFWLSLGPFVHVGGVNTYAPGLWAFLRYAPVIGLARSPSRFAIVAILGLSVLFAFALDELSRRSAKAWRPIATALALALALELAPMPRQLYPTAVPDLYDRVTAGSDESERLLDLPVGIHDGTSPVGRFNAATQYFQTKHRRPVLGAYLSRVAPQVKEEYLHTPMLRALFALSEGKELPAEWKEEGKASRDAFLRRSCVRFVVVDKLLASNQLREFAVDALDLRLEHEDAEYALLTPANPPACDRASGQSSRPGADRAPR